MISPTCKSIIEIDSFLDQYTLGTLVIEDGQANLDLSNGEIITLNDSFAIELILNNGNQYYPISYHQAINTKDDYGWHTFAGFDCRVKAVA